MIKLKITPIIIIIWQIFYSCSSTGTGLKDKTSQLDNRIVYYGLNQMSFLSDEKSTYIDTVAYGAYPIWLDSKTKIGFHSVSNANYYIIDAENKETLNTFNLSGYGTMIAGRYSEKLEVFIFDVNNHGLRSIAIMDWDGNIDIMNNQHPVYNPVCSGVDDWIYYLKNVDGTRDVYRMKPDGSLEEEITNSLEYKYSNFSVSHDVNYIVVPKWNDDNHFIAIIDTDTFNETLIDLTFLKLVGYTSFSKDNKYIYFTGDENRNLYQIKFDGTELKQLTNIGYLYRPLSW